MNEIRSHRDLEVWRIGMEAVLETYRLSAEFPKSETYGLTSQMRRAAVSVPSNIAEGRRLLHGLRRAKRRHLALSLGGPASVLVLALRLFW